MKTLAIIFGLSFSLFITSCSKCYNCSYEVEFDTNQDGIIDSTATSTDEEFCTADSREIQAREDAGYTCK